MRARSVAMLYACGQKVSVQNARKLQMRSFVRRYVSTRLTS